MVLSACFPLQRRFESAHQLRLGVTSATRVDSDEERGRAEADLWHVTSRQQRASHTMNVDRG
eukprot:3562018-Rhodomonas_salina.2